MELHLDTSFFAIVCELDGALYTTEIDVADMRTSQIIEDIRAGQLENVRAVFEFNPAEGWCADVTRDVMDNANTEAETGEDHTDFWSDYNSERLDARRAGVRTRVAA